LLLDVQRATNGHAFDHFLGTAYFYQGNRALAEEVLSVMSGNTPSDRRGQAVLASFLAVRGERIQAEALLRTLTGGAFMDHHVAYSIGVANLYLGKRPESQRWLQKAADTGLLCYPWYRQDSLLDPLRKEPEFQSFLAQMQQSWESAKERYGEGNRQPHR
jgi:hypothetical protein